MSERNEGDSVKQRLSYGVELVPDSVFKLSSCFCGCGDPDEAWAWVFDYMSWRNENGHKWVELKTGPEWIAAYLLDHLGLTEHGGNICGAWLTKDGKELLAFLEKYGYEWQSKWEFISSTGISLGEFGVYHKDHKPEGA